MKDQRLLKILFGGLLTVILAASLAAQNQPTPPGPRGQTPPPQPGRGDTSAITAAPSSNFLNTAIEINQAEVELGQLAAMKAQSQSVKTYAQMLVKDHSVALQKLQKLQSDSSRSTPALSPQHQELKTRLTGLSGSQFDHTYIDAMVMGHREAVKLFDQEIASAPSRPEPPAKPNEPDVPSVAKELLPTIKNHLAEAEKIQKALK